MGACILRLLAFIPEGGRVVKCPPPTSQVVMVVLTGLALVGSLVRVGWQLWRSARDIDAVCGRGRKLLLTGRAGAILAWGAAAAIVCYLWRLLLK